MARIMLCVRNVAILLCLAAANYFACRDFSAPVMGVLSSGGVTVESLSSQYLSTTGISQATIVWRADRDGTYSVRIGASNCASGTNIVL